MDNLRIMPLIDDLKQSFANVKVEYYRSKLPILLGDNLPTALEKSTTEKANDIHISINNHIVLRFFGSRYRAGGVFINQNLGDTDSSRIISILNQNEIYTRRQTAGFISK
jgi:hypothetical protein